jgi:hypothetical protein
MGSNHLSLDAPAALIVVTAVSAFTAAFSMRVGIALFFIGMIAICLFNAIVRRYK